MNGSSCRPKAHPTFLKGAFEHDGTACVGKNYRGYVKLLEPRKSMGCNDKPIEWNFEHRANDAEDLWCILSWIEPYGTGV